MEEFVDKLINESDQWITPNAINDKTIFESTIQKVFSQLPSPSKEILSNNSIIINSLWTKLQQKYDESSNNNNNQFFSKIDINEYINNQNEGINKNKALQSNNTSLKHYPHSKLNPFFKSYNNISYDYINDLFDILSTNNNKYNNEWFPLIQFRFNQLLSNKSNTNKNIRILTQKLYRLFCANIELKCKNKETINICLLCNQILLMCKNNLYCKDLSMNILTFIRVLFEYNKQNKIIENSIDIKTLITKLFSLIICKYNLFFKWSNTKQLIFLWTIYECNQNNFIYNKQLEQLLKWNESMFLFNELINIFNNKSIDSFADFTNIIYKYNMLSVIKHVSDSDNDYDSEQYEFDDDYDVMNIQNETEIINNINDIKDEDLFIVDINNNNNNKRLRDNDSVLSMDDELPTKKQKIYEP